MVHKITKRKKPKKPERNKDYQRRIDSASKRDPSAKYSYSEAVDSYVGATRILTLGVLVPPNRRMETLGIHAAQKERICFIAVSFAISRYRWIF
jgi:hypothetical protein